MFDMKYFVFKDEEFGAIKLADPLEKTFGGLCLKDSLSKGDLDELLPASFLVWLTRHEKNFSGAKGTIACTLVTKLGRYTEEVTASVLPRRIMPNYKEPVFGLFEKLCELFDINDKA